MNVSQFDREHVPEIMAASIDISSFSRQLLRLCAKADSECLELLARGFPDHVAVYRAWFAGGKLPRARGIPVVPGRGVNPMPEGVRPPPARP